MNTKILFVDDEQNILDSINRTLRKKFDLDLALGPEEGLAKINNEGPFSIVVSDYKMPKMHGIEFLNQVKQMAPDTIRVMLTGQADLDVVVSSINEGNIYRFITKPCASEHLIKIIEDCLEQHRLKLAERSLLKDTLYGAAKILVDILALVSPIAFSKASRLKRYACHMATHLDPEDTWLYELSAMLSQIGCITVPSEIISKINTGKALDAREKELFENHPNVASGMLESIPRLETVAAMVADQFKPYYTYPEKDLTKIPKEVLGSQILKLIIDFDSLIYRGKSHEEAIEWVKNLPKEYNPTLVNILKDIRIGPVGNQYLSVEINALETDMIFNQDVFTTTDMLLVSRGQEVTLPIIARLQSFAKSVGVKEPISVYKH